MKILSLRDKKSPTPILKSELLADQGVGVIDHSPTLMSAFAAMRIASILDKMDITVIEAGSMKDAMAALSARKLARKKGVRVIMNIAPNSELPKSVTAEIRHGVDGWIFPSGRMRKAFPQDLSNPVVIPTTSFDDYADIKNLATQTDIPSPGQKQASATAHIPVISWIGDITRPERLKAYLEEAETAQGHFRIRICGTGKAAHVMPVVRFSRHLSRNKDIEWTGEDYDIKTEIEAAVALLSTNEDTTEIEACGILSGRPLLRPGELTSFLTGAHIPEPETISPEEYIRRYAAVLEALG